MTDDKKHKTDAEKSQYRRDKIKAATPATLTKDELSLMTKMYQVARQMSASTGTKYQVDHIIPLAIGGLHVPENLQIITEEQNKKRGSTGSKLPEEGAILSHMVKDDTVRSKGKFVKGVSGNPNGRPKKVVAEPNKDDKLWFSLMAESGGDIVKFRELVQASLLKFNCPFDEFTKRRESIEKIMSAQQKVDKNSEDRVSEIKFFLIGEEKYDILLNKYKSEKSND